MVPLRGPAVRFSDGVIAWSRFIGAVPGRTYVVMVPYYLAQCLFFCFAVKSLPALPSEGPIRVKIASARAVRPPMARRHPARNLFIHVPPPCRLAARRAPPLLAETDHRHSTGLICGGWIVT